MTDHAITDLELMALLAGYDPPPAIRVEFTAPATTIAQLGDDLPSALIGTFVAISAGPFCHAGRARIADADRDAAGALVVAIDLGPDTDPALWGWLRDRFARWR